MSTMCERAPGQRIAKLILWRTVAAAMCACATLSPPLKAEPSEQRTLITVRDVSGMPGAPVPLGVLVQTAAPDGNGASVHVGGLPKGAQLSDGSRTASAAVEQGLVEVSGWDLPNTTFSMPAGVTGQFNLTLVVTVETGDRPLFTQAAFVVNIGEDRTYLSLSPRRTVQTYVGPHQVSVSTAHEVKLPEPMPSGVTDQGLGKKVSDPASNPYPARGDPVTEALAADRKLWLEREQTRTETLTRELVAAHEQIGELRSKVTPSAGEAPELRETDLTRLLGKANELIRPGDVSGARLLLERALETGSPEAAFYLAQTYDPRVLHSWNVQGILPDREKARELYNRAQGAGLSRAKDFVDLMR